MGYFILLTGVDYTLAVDCMLLNALVGEVDMQACTLLFFAAHYVRMIAQQSSDVEDIHRGESLRLPPDIPYERFVHT